MTIRAEDDEQTISSPVTWSPGRLVQGLVVVIPTLAAFGPMMPVVRPFYAFRIAVLLLFAVVAVTWFRSHRRAVRPALFRAVVASALVWAFSGIAALTMVTDFRLAASDVLAVMCGWLLLLSVLRLGVPGQTLQWLSWGWVGAFVVMASIATFETAFQRHMSNYILTPFLEQGVGEHLAAAAFGNPNLFALFLAMGLPVLLYRFEMARTRRGRVAVVGLVLWLFVALLYSGGRLATLAVIVIVIVWWAGMQGAWRSLSAWTMLVGLIAVVAIGVIGPPRPEATVQAGPERSKAPPGKISSTTLAEVTGRASADGTANSGSVRLDLTKRAGEMMVDTYGLGVGPGNFGTWIDDNGERYNLAGVRSPHNGVTEVTTEYGAGALLATVVLYVLVLRRAIRTGFRSARPDGAAARLVLVTGAAFPVFALSNSTFWDPPTTWVALSIFVVAAASVRPRERRRAQENNAARNSEASVA